MKKILLTLAAVICCHLALCAQVINEQEAKKRALQFLNNRAPAAVHGHRASLKTAQLKKAELDVSGIYAFNCEDGGFVIASADERTVPVLGYSDSGRIDWQQMPANMRAWLTGYAQVINNLGDAPLKAGEQSPSARQAVAPLLKTTWYQNSPYNDECPMFGISKVLTGCVATAMAQVMNYYQWPKNACEPIPEYSFEFKDAPYPLDALPATTFDWDNMLNDYSKGYTDEQAAAVAHLMRYCGQSVLMTYGGGVSMADAANIADALRLYFDYDAGATYLYRNLYGIDEWEQIIYNELAEGRPVPYTGQGEGGHCFVCDGYDGNGLFHINWGWAGEHDGYFALSVLNPYDASCYSGFSYGQEAIIGIQPPTGQGTTADYSPTLRGFDNIALHDNTVSFIAFYDNLVTPVAKFEIAMGTIDEGEKLTPVVMAEKQYEIKPKDVDTIYIALSKDNLPVGTHQLLPMARCTTTDGPWHTLYAPEKKVVAKVTEADIQCMLAHLPDLSIGKTYIKNGPGIASEPNDVALVIDNKGHDYAGDLDLCFIPLGDKTSQEACQNLPPKSEMSGNYKVGAYLRAASTEEMLFPFKELGNDKKYLFLLYEDFSDVLLDTVTVVFDKDYEFEFADLEVVSYKIKNTDWDFIYKITLKNNGPNNWPKYANKPDSLKASYNFGQLGNSYTHQIYIPVGEEVTFGKNGEGLSELGPVTFTLDESLADGRTKRILEVTVQPNETLEYPGSTGISSIAASSTHSQQLYNLAGQRVGESTTKGVYIRGGRKVVIK